MYSSSQDVSDSDETYQRVSHRVHVLIRPDTYVGNIQPLTEKQWIITEKQGEESESQAKDGDETGDDEPTADEDPNDEDFAALKKKKPKQKEPVQPSSNIRFDRKEITYVPALYKIFDEILVNAADNKQRQPPLKQIQVNIDKETGKVSVWNDGKGIRIQKQKDDVTGKSIWIPEFIFGHLLTSSHYDDTKKRVTGGRNGFGAKLTNIFSKFFVVECSNQEDGLLYIQFFHNNMYRIGRPYIFNRKGLIEISDTEEKTADEEAADQEESAEDEEWFQELEQQYLRGKKFKGSSYTKITFYPDFPRFGMGSFNDNSTYDLMKRRVYDMAGILDGVKVFFDEELVPIKNWQEYCSMFVHDPRFVPIHYKDMEGLMWQIAVGPSKGDEQRQVSFVNAVATPKGGTHVKYISDQVEKYLKDQMAKMKPKVIVKEVQIRRCLSIYVNCLIDSPSFDSQTKDTLTLPSKTFSEQCKLPETFLKKLTKTLIVDLIREASRNAEKSTLSKIKGSKSGHVYVEKLDDANQAGKRGSRQCTLILTEGDSAKTMAVTGLSVIGRDYYGVFPLRGKLLNTREASADKLAANEEIKNICTIMGLNVGRHYEDGIDSLRYGHIMIMTDQDPDGSHIKGLIINFIHSYWPELFKNNNFLCEFITPLVKCTRGKVAIPFYTINEFVTWKKQNNNGKGWKIKYYKGLATSTVTEQREYFKDFDQHKKDFKFKGGEDEEAIQLAFSKKRADDRKKWLASIDSETTYLDQEHVDSITYKDFVDKELVLFSHYANVRAIPSVLDGLKPGQRKILWVCLKNNIFKELRVVQLSGKVSEQSAYHHGEESLNQTIIKMAQDYVGSNNINVLWPVGSFGTRISLGQDSGSPRYIHTHLSVITRKIFHKDDDQLLHQLTDEGMVVEPSYYIPVIPMILVNGAEGIGVGWSSSVPCFNPVDIINNLRRKLNNEELVEMVPWYSGFSGTITKQNDQRWICEGIATKVDDTTIRISEIPIGVAIEKYKAMLYLMAGHQPPKKEKDKGKGKGKGKKKAEPIVKKAPDSVPRIVDLRDYSSYVSPDFEIDVTPEQMEEIERVGILKYFDLIKPISANNMTLFDSQGKIRQFKNAEEIIEDYIPTRMQFYEKRRDRCLENIKIQLTKLSNQARFVKEVNEGTLKIQRVPISTILKVLQDTHYDPLTKDMIEGKHHRVVSDEAIEEEEEPNEDADIIDSEKMSDLHKGYDYLLSMRMVSMTLERYNKLIEERDKAQRDYDALYATEPVALWLRDLDELEAAYKEFEIMRIKSREETLKDVENTKKPSKKRKAPAKPKPKAEPKVKTEPKPNVPVLDEDIITDAEKEAPKTTKRLKPKAEPKEKPPPKPRAKREPKKEPAPKKETKPKPKTKSPFEESESELSASFSDDGGDVTTGVALHRSPRRTKADTKIEFKKSFQVSSSSDEESSSSETEDDSDSFEED